MNIILIFQLNYKYYYSSGTQIFMNDSVRNPEERIINAGQVRKKKKRQKS